MKFEEFLKKNTSDNILKLAQINVKDLGEWAWEEIQRLSKPTAWIGTGFNVGRYGLCKELAIACLGKKEIEKRLRKLN